jgi:hypothetical protein
MTGLIGPFRARTIHSDMGIPPSAHFQMLGNQ